MSGQNLTPPQGGPVGTGEAMTFPEGYYATVRDEEDYDRDALSTPVDLDH